VTLDEPGAEVEIGGSPFVLGAVYTSGRRVPAWRPRAVAEAPRRLLAYHPDFPWVGGRVEVARIEGCDRRERRMDMTGRAWVAWARKVVE
jgi:hypothetical protein